MPGLTLHMDTISVALLLSPSPLTSTPRTVNFPVVATHSFISLTNIACLAAE